MMLVLTHSADVHHSMAGVFNDILEKPFRLDVNIFVNTNKHYELNYVCMIRM